MAERLRYRLQRKEPYSMPCIIGNHSYPLPTYRWKDIVVSNDRAELEKLKLNAYDYRIIDTLEGTIK